MEHLGVVFDVFVHYLKGGGVDGGGTEASAVGEQDVLVFAVDPKHFAGLGLAVRSKFAAQRVAYHAELILGLELVGALRKIEQHAIDLMLEHFDGLAGLCVGFVHHCRYA